MHEVIWSEESETDYYNNIDYLLEEWTEREAENFIYEVEDIINQLRQGNTEFRRLGYKNFRVVPLISRKSLIYVV